MNDDYNSLKQEFINFITENNTCTDAEQRRKNIRKLREEIEERAERRQAGLKDLDSYADEQTQQRVLGRIQLEKQALDDAIDEILVGGKLSFEREAFTKLSKTTGISRKAASRIQSTTTGVLKFIVLQFLALCACIYLAPMIWDLGQSLYGTVALLVKGIFEDSSYLDGVLSYALREIPASLSILAWPFSEAGKQEHLGMAMMWGLIFYLNVFSFVTRLLRKR